jgi:hypothetical protein
MSSIPSYSIENVPLMVCDTVKDLGITIDRKLKYSTHIDNIVARAKQRCGIFYRGFASRNFNLVSKVFVTYIRPLLEFNSYIWSPTAKYLISKLESVQRTFTKRIPDLQHLSYLERLTALKLEPLELRRLRADCIMYYKIMNNLTCISSSSVFNFHVDVRSLRNNNSTRLVKPIHLSNTLMQSFFNRSIDLWNSLPAAITTATSLSAFKRLLLLHDITSFLKGDLS